MKIALLLSVLLLAPSLSRAEEHASQNPDALAIDSACTAEASTASCGDKKVGTGLLKCIHAYKREHRKDFKISDGCKEAMKKGREDRKAKKKS